MKEAAVCGATASQALEHGSGATTCAGKEGNRRSDVGQGVSTGPLPIAASRARAVAAVLSVWPELAPQQASAEAVNAVAYAAGNHTEWFWRGVGG
jgi:hypothetical protein